MLKRPLLAASAALFIWTAASAASPSDEARQAQNFPGPPIRAQAGVVMDGKTGKVLASVNAHLRLPMASTTKVMTALVALQHGNLTDRIRVPASAFNYDPEATVMGLRPGQVVTLKNLLYGLLLPSGADAANTIAIHYGGSESGFAGLMNREAKKLGMRDTHYSNAHGLSAYNHHTSAYDLAVLGRKVSGISALMKIVSTRRHVWNGQTLVNLNRVLFWYPGLDGIKPGWIPEAGICQLLDARRDGRHVVVALLNTPDVDIDARNLLNFGLRDFSWVRSTLPGDRPSLTLTGYEMRVFYGYFVGSGHYVRGGFWRAYSANGRLSALGYPRTEPVTEGRSRIQFFQNMALSRNPSNGKVSRARLGLTPVPTSTVPSPSPTPLPKDAVTRLGSAPKATPAPNPSGPSLHPRATAPVFASFYRRHAGMLGSAVSPLSKSHNFSVQIFMYGALAYNQKTHAIYLLPLADRLLSSRHYLPAHPGNVYPAGFAPLSALKAIGWISSYVQLKR